eukprot:365336-Chlamydomonas_euryale.AAC.7
MTRRTSSEHSFEHRDARHIQALHSNQKKRSHLDIPCTPSAVLVLIRGLLRQDASFERLGKRRLWQALLSVLPPRSLRFLSSY